MAFFSKHSYCKLLPANLFILVAGLELPNAIYKTHAKRRLPFDHVDRGSNLLAHSKTPILGGEGFVAIPRFMWLVPRLHRPVTLKSHDGFIDLG